MFMVIMALSLAFAYARHVRKTNIRDKPEINKHNCFFN